MDNSQYDDNGDEVLGNQGTNTVPNQLGTEQPSNNQPATQAAPVSESAPKPAPSGTTSESGVITPGSFGGATPTSSGGGTSSGSFNNIQKFISANKDFNADSGGLAGSVAKNIGTAANTASQNVAGAQNAFQTQAQTNANTFTNPDLVNQALANPSDFVQNQDNVNAFNQIRDAQYSGPQSLQDLQGPQNLANLQVQAAGVNDLVNQGQSEAGRFNLLKQMFGTNTYNRGQQNLDNLLLQSNPDQLKTIQATRPQALQIQQDLNQNNTNAQALANQFKQQAADTQTNVRGQLNNTVQSNFDTLNQQASDAQNTFNQNYSNLQNNLKAGNLNSDVLSKLGLQQGQYLYGTDLGKALGQNTAQANMQNVASASDYARLNALSTLAGQTLSPEEAATMAQFSDPSKAGAFANTNVLDFLNAENPQAVANDIAAHKSAVEQSSDWLNNQNMVGQAGQAEGRIAGVNSSESALQNAQNAYLAAQQRFQQASTTNPNDYINALQAQQQAQAARDAAIQSTIQQISTLSGSGYAAQALGLRPDWSGQGMGMNTADQNVDWLLNGGKSFIDQGSAFEAQKKAAAQAALQKLMGTQLNYNPDLVTTPVTGNGSSRQ